MTTRNIHYDKFFESGGWKYDLESEKCFLQRRIIDLAKWKCGEHILEIGAGMGHHSELLRRLGFKVTAVESSHSGIEYLRRHYPCIEAVEADISEWAPAFLPDHIFARGMSYFHYELNGVNVRGVDVVRETQRMFEWLGPEGTFVLQICTDFSGRKGDVHMNCFSDYYSLFSQFGTVVAHTDWIGRSLPLDPVPPDAAGVIIVTKKRAQSCCKQLDDSNSSRYGIGFR